MIVACYRQMREYLLYLKAEALHKFSQGLRVCDFSNQTLIYERTPAGIALITTREFVLVALNIRDIRARAQKKRAHLLVSGG